jgi:hydroxyacylglutathione hydrolase
VVGSATLAQARAGPAWLGWWRTLSHVHVHQAELWLAVTNCYVVAAERGGPAVVVDAPPDLEGVTRLVQESGSPPVALLLTHGHVDHMASAERLVRRHRLVARLHPDDDWLAADPVEQVRFLFGMVPPGDYEPLRRYEDLVDNEVLDLAGLEFRVLHTPGHTPGHCCFHVESEGVLFSGDHLFAGSIGRTDLPGGDYTTLMRSMEERVMTLPAATDVLPGHGPATTLARELATNPFLQELRR